MWGFCLHNLRPADKDLLKTAAVSNEKKIIIHLSKIYRQVHTPYPLEDPGLPST